MLIYLLDGNFVMGAMDGQIEPMSSKRKWTTAAGESGAVGVEGGEAEIDRGAGEAVATAETGVVDVMHHNLHPCAHRQSGKCSSASA